MSRSTTMVESTLPVRRVKSAAPKQPCSNGRSLLVRHATPARNLASIQRDGLLTGKSRGRLAAVWFHALSKTAWATLHTEKRHGGRIEDVVILKPAVPRHWLRRNRRGLWYSTKD